MRIRLFPLLLPAFVGALLSPRCLASPDSVVSFNEIQYNPAGASESGEWVELFNQMGIKVDVSGWRIDGLGYTFPAGTILNPGAYAVVAKSPGAGQFGPFTGSIGNDGQRLRLINQSDRMMDEVEFQDDDPWPAGADGAGATLAKILPYTGSLAHAHWTISTQSGGTPGAVNFAGAGAPGGVRINEMPAATAPGFWLELINTGTTTLALGGMVVSADADPLREYTLPAGTLAPGGIHLVTQATLGFRPADGEKIFLLAAGKTSVLDARPQTGRLRGRAAARGGEWAYPNVETPGAANTFAFNNSVVISEIQYNPPALAPVPAVPPTFQVTPLVGFGDAWRYNQSDDSLAAGWASVAHTVGGNWKTGAGPLGVESAALPVPLATTLTPYAQGTVTYYFEREFTVTAQQLATAESLEITHQIDDGAVFYLNGSEAARFNMPAGAVDAETLATPGVGEASLVSLVLPTSGLQVGTNRLSVEVHQSSTGSSDVVFGLKLDARVVLTPGVPGQPLRNSDNQWIEVANRSAASVDLTGWDFGDGIDFAFAPGTVLAAGEHACIVRDAGIFSAAYPGARILGTFAGSLSRSGEHLVLRDPSRNTADEVRYFDGGQWPEFADGGGSSVELRDLDADGMAGGSWAASDESSRTAWKTYTYRGTAAASNGPDGQWSEFNMGLMGAGEMWIDDLSVVELPSGAATQKLTDTGFNTAAAWRLRGNHRHSALISEPGNAGNKILRLVATGPTEHMHNQVETTLASPVVNGREYQISFRARWVTGASQLHTRLYFNRLARMNVIDRVSHPGTPSAPNSRAVANAGPSYAGLRHAPAVPAAAQAVTVSAAASDPDGLGSMALFYSVNGGAFLSTAMPLVDGRYAGTIPGQTAGAVVQFYLQGTDGVGAVSTHPAAGPASRALYKVNDGTAATNGWHNFRLITTLADRNFMHTATEVMSNDRIEATIIDREGDIYYGAGVRLKSSERGRNQTARVGYNVEFPPDGLFRGVHSGVAVDRSEGVGTGQRELLFDMMISNSGGPISRYYDFIKILSPNSALTGGAVLQLARYDDIFLDEQFENGSDGFLYEYELVYFPTTATAAGAKLPEPDGVVGVPVSNLGDDPESYRWNFLNKINREADNFTPIMNYAKLFSKSGAEFENSLPSVVDVDVWFRGMAYAVLTGAGDNAAAGDQHNGIYYARPDGRVIFLPHDMDFAFDATRSIFANPQCAALTANPGRLRQYLGHLQDIITTTYNNSYMATWSTHFASLDPSQDWASELSYLTSRSNNVLSQINSRIPAIAFAITTPGPLTVNGSTATIAGNGWVNVRGIRQSGTTAFLPVTWTSANTWQVAASIPPGPSTVTLEAVNFSGAVIGSASLAVNNTTTVTPASAATLVVSEIMYHPADLTATEVNAGFTDSDQFEYIEVMNISPYTVNMTGVRFTAGLDYDFASGALLPPGERLVIARDRTALLARHPGAASRLAVGAFLNTTGLANGGESLQLSDAGGGVIKSFAFDDAFPWPVSPDGGGESLVLIAPAANPDHSLATNWRSSAAPGGTPGSGDAVAFTGDPSADADRDGLNAFVEHAIGTSDLVPNGGTAESDPAGTRFTIEADGHLTFEATRNLSADDALFEAQLSHDLTTWDAAAMVLVSELPNGDGTSTLTWRSVTPIAGRAFTRLNLRAR